MVTCGDTGVPVPLQFCCLGRQEGLGLGPWSPLAGSAALRSVLNLTTSWCPRLYKWRVETTQVGFGASEACARRPVAGRDARGPETSAPAPGVCRIDTSWCGFSSQGHAPPGGPVPGSRPSQRGSCQRVPSLACPPRGHPRSVRLS